MKTSQVFGVVCLAVFLLMTDKLVTHVDDETAIASVARQDPALTIRAFADGQGQHEHPPLSDIVLHYWLRMIGNSLAMFRVVNIVAFAVGMYFLARAVSIFCCERAGLWFSSLCFVWPLGYQFGRMFGWYSFAFLFASMAIFSLASFSQRVARSFLALVFCSVALVYTNYFGWAFVSYFAFRMATRRNLRISWAVTYLVAISIAYIPMWRVLFLQSIKSMNLRSTLSASAAKSFYGAYLAILSESVAPWLMPVGILCAIGAVLVVAMVLRYSSGELRWLMVFFLGSVTLVGCSGMFSPKRVLFLCPFLLVPLGATLYSLRGIPGRVLRCVALMLWTVSWVCIASRTGYAAAHTIEPWRAMAREAIGVANGGVYVVSNSPSFHFYVDHFLNNASGSAPDSLQKIVRVEGFREQDGLNAHRVRVYQGVNSSLMAETDRVLTWLGKNCETRGEKRLVHDSGFALKSRLFPATGQEEYRIVIYDFDCRAPVDVVK
jgi:hypothetical protein